MRASQSLLAAVAVTAALAALPGCVRTAPPPEGPLSIRVTMNEAAGDPVGSDEDPIPFSHDPTTLTVDMEVLDYDATRMESFEGKVHLQVRPGVLVDPLTVELTGGHAEAVPVQIKSSFGPTRIWVEDTVREGASYATGLSPSLRFADPTLAQIQQSPAGGSVSPLVDNYVEVRAADRELIVTFVASDGFGVTDVTDPPGSYNSIYPFTFSRPRDVEVGDKLASLSGQVDEYLSWTELSFPAFTVESSGHAIPEPATLTHDDLCGGDLEAWESSVVRVEDVVSAFSEAQHCDDYENYGQWPVFVGDEDCGGQPPQLTIISNYTVPGLRFDCEDGLPENVEFAYLQGMLKQIDAADVEWTLMVRGCEDLPPENWPADCLEESEAAKNHFSGPPPMPREFDRRGDRSWGVTYELD